MYPVDTGPHVDIWTSPTESAAYTTPTRADLARNVQESDATVPRKPDLARSVHESVTVNRRATVTGEAPTKPGPPI